MKATTRIVVVVLIVALGVGVFFVLRSKRRAYVGTSELRAASILVLEGPLRSYGEQVRIGINLAVEEIREQQGDKLSITFKSFDGDPTKAEDQLKTAVIHEHHKFVVEVFGTPAALQVCKFVNQNKVLSISGVDTGHLLSENMGKYFFRIIPSDGEAVKAQMNWAKELDAKKGAVVAVTTDWGKGMAEMVEYYAKTYGLSAVRFDVDKSHTLFEPIVASLKDKAVGVVFLALNPDQAGNFVRAARAAEFHPIILGTDNLTAGEFTVTAGKAAIGVCYVLPPSSEDSPLRKAVAAKLRSKLGLSSEEEPHPFALYGYDETWLLYRAMKASHGDPDRAVSFLESYEGKGATGLIRFDKNHDVILSGPYRRMEFMVSTTGKIISEEVR